MRATHCWSAVDIRSVWLTLQQRRVALMQSKAQPPTEYGCMGGTARGRAVVGSVTAADEVRVVLPDAAPGTVLMARKASRTGARLLPST